MFALVVILVLVIGALVARRIYIHTALARLYEQHVTIVTQQYEQYLPSLEKHHMTKQ
jgi:mannose/fructose/N-acetylgalactosamine-specific phosphotransferase system component IID